MNARTISLWLVLAAIAAGTISDIPSPDPYVTLGGYRVLAADFHIHSFPLNWALLDPLDTVLEARRQKLDVIALTGHNEVWEAYVGRCFSRLIHGPKVLIGDEIINPKYHLLAIGIRHSINWRQSSANAIDAIHRQGGVAIAAHPAAPYWPGYDAEAMSKLDGSEVLHPIAYGSPDVYRELQEFYGRARLTAIGDSDYHGLGPMGLCRTFVFARDDSGGAILDALRTRHTVVYDRYGRAFGDPDLIHLTQQDPSFRELLKPPSSEGMLTQTSRAAGLLGLLGLCLFNPRGSKDARPNRTP